MYNKYNLITIYTNNLLINITNYDKFKQIIIFNINNNYIYLINYS